MMDARNGEIGMSRSIEQSPWEAYEALIESIMQNADHDFWDSGSDIEAVAYVRHLEDEIERLRRVCLRRALRTWVDEFDEEADRDLHGSILGAIEAHDAGPCRCRNGAACLADTIVAALTGAQEVPDGD